MAHNRRITIEEVENGYQVSFLRPSSNPESIYDDSIDLVAKSKDEVVEMVGQFLDHQEIKQKSQERDVFIKPQQRTLLGGQ
jgi:Zn-dependent metalloprotease